MNDEDILREIYRDTHQLTTAENLASKCEFVQSELTACENDFAEIYFCTFENAFGENKTLVFIPVAVSDSYFDNK